MSEKSEGGKEGQAPERPAAAEPTERPASDRGQESVNLSIEEKGMVVMPAVPVPTNEVDIGNMPSADTSSAEGGGEGGSGTAGDGGSAGDSGE